MEIHSFSLCVSFVRVLNTCYGSICFRAFERSEKTKQSFVKNQFFYLYNKDTYAV